MISPILYSLHVDDMPTPSQHVELALNANDTAATATSRMLVLLISCLETPQQTRKLAERKEDSHQHLEENHDALCKDLEGHLQVPISTTLQGTNLLG